MNLAGLKDELRALGVAGSYSSSFTGWINDAVLEIAADFELPELKLREPTSLSTTTSDWLYDLPSTYHKKVFKCRNEDYTQIGIAREIDYIDQIDSDHDETGDSVTDVAVEGGQIAIYPKANDTLYLWFYRLPVSMSATTDTPDGIPSSYHARVIIPKVIIKNFLLIGGTDAIAADGIGYWQSRYRAGLFGEPGGDVGMINFFAKSKGVRRHGGSDPLP